MARFDFVEELDREKNKRVGKIIDRVTGNDIILYHQERRDDFYDSKILPSGMGELVRLLNKLERREFV